jgi:hypothetical protein
MLKIAKVKHPGNTKFEICNDTSKLIVALGFGVKINGKAKWKTPKIKMNNNSTVPAFNAFTFANPLTVYNQNNLMIIR